MDQLADRPGEWLTLTVAAERLGWRLHRVRSLARRQDWPKRRPNAGSALEYLIPAELLARPPAKPPDDDGFAETGLVAELRDQVTDLAIRLGRAEGELAAELRRSADLVVAIAELRDELAQARAELAESRRPVLVRLVEALRQK